MEAFLYWTFGPHCMATQLCWTVVTWKNNIIWELTHLEHGRNPEKRVQWWYTMQKLAGVFKTHLQSHREPFFKHDAWRQNGTFVRNKKILRTPLRGILPTSAAATFSLFLSFPPSLCLPLCSSMSQKVSQCQAEARTCHATQTHTTLMRTPPCLLHNYPFWTHTHINTSQSIVTSGPGTLSRFHGFWIRRDNSNVFKKSWRDCKLPSCFALSSEE